MKTSSTSAAALAAALCATFVAPACGGDETPAPPSATATTTAPSGAPAVVETLASDGAPAPMPEAVPLRTLELGDELKVEILREGAKRTAEIGDTLLARYECRVKDAEQPFATTRGMLQPQKLVLDPKSPSRPIDGLLRALIGLPQGTRARVHVPPALAYGKDGLPSSAIPADASLVVDVEIVEVLR